MLPNLGFGHLLVIIVVGLIVFGPKRLPEIMRSFGKMWRMVQAESEKATTQLRSVIDDDDKPAVATSVVIDTPDEMAIRNEAAAEAAETSRTKERKTTVHAPKPRKPPAKTKNGPAKNASSKNPSNKNGSTSLRYPIGEDT